MLQSAFELLLSCIKWAYNTWYTIGIRFGVVEILFAFFFTYTFIRVMLRPMIGSAGLSDKVIKLRKKNNNDDE